jgi:ammonia channel protein AmtB
LQGHTIEPWYLLGINVAGGVCIALWAGFCSFLIFFSLNYFNLLRINPQTEYKGVDICEHGEAAYPVDAWVELQYNHNNGSERPTIPKIMQGTAG